MTGILIPADVFGEGTAHAVPAADPATQDRVRLLAFDDECRAGEKDRGRLAASAQVHRCGEGDDPIGRGCVTGRRRHGEDKPALAEADGLDQQFISGARELDYVTGVEITRQNLLLHGRGRYRPARPMSPAPPRRQASHLHR